MTSRALTATEARIREHVLAINLGYCGWCGVRPAKNGCHRLPEGQRGPYIPANLLPGCGSGTTGCHWRTEQARTLSYACGWLIRARDREDFVARSARIAATPALVRTQLAPHGAWHVLDHIEPETGRPAWMPRLAEPGEVPAEMWRGAFDAEPTFEQALAALNHRARTSA